MTNLIKKYKSLTLKAKIFIWFIVVIFILIIIPTDDKVVSVDQVVVEKGEVQEIESGNTIPNEEKITEVKPITQEVKSYSVTRVIDGDTIDVSIDGKIERLRLIGIDTPETVDPRKPVECFGVEASNKAKGILAGKKVILESDPSQGEKDKYNRLLRYVFLEDGTNFNLLMIKEGYAYEYTYGIPYKYQIEFKQAQKEAERTKAGLWGAKCDNTDTASITPVSSLNTANNSCTIKGNISSTKEKIYHMVGCGSYAKTTIDETKGERWFCTEQEALDAGWRKALNCN